MDSDHEPSDSEESNANSPVEEGPVDSRIDLDFGKTITPIFEGMLGLGDSASEKRNTEQPLSEEDEPQSPEALWWAIWIGINIFSRVTARWGADTARELVNLTSLMAFEDVANIVAAALAIAVVRATTNRQEGLVQRLSGHTTPTRF